MKLKRGFNFILLVGYLTLAIDQQPASAGHRPGRRRNEG